MRRALALAVVVAAGCSGEPASANTPAASARTRESARRTPLEAVRRRDPAFTAENEAASQPGTDAANPDATRQPPRVTAETLEAALRDVAHDSNELAAAFNDDPAVARRMVELLLGTNDEALLAGLLRAFCFLANVEPVHEQCRDELVRGLAMDGPWMRRAAALQALRAMNATARPEVRAAVFARMRIERAPQVAQSVAESLERGLLAPEERNSLLECATGLDVPFEAATPVRHPARLARRMVYEELAADAVRRNDWSPLIDRIDTLRSDNERQDLIAGLAVIGDYIDGPDAGAVGTPERATTLAARRGWLGKLYRSTEDRACRQRFLSSARRGLRALPRDASEPEEERIAAAAFLRELIAFEVEPGTLAVLRATLAEIEPAPPR